MRGQWRKDEKCIYMGRTKGGVQRHPEFDHFLLVLESAVILSNIDIAPFLSLAE